MSLPRNESNDKSFYTLVALENYGMINNFYSFRLLNVSFFVLSQAVGHYLHTVVKLVEIVGFKLKVNFKFEQNTMGI